MAICKMHELREVPHHAVFVLLHRLQVLPKLRSKYALEDPIPADIAEKLGIEPKEDIC